MGIKRSESQANLAAALAKAQAEIKGAVKDSANPFFKSRYADLESCWDAIREPFSKHGLSVVQVGGYQDNAGPTIVTTLLHSSGEWIEGEAPIFPKSQAPQDLGSAITYSRRYWLCAITGLYQTDDDGESAMGRGQNMQGQTAARTQQMGQRLASAPPQGRPSPAPATPRGQDAIFDGPEPDLRGPRRQ